MKKMMTINEYIRSTTIDKIDKANISNVDFSKMQLFSFNSEFNELNFDLEEFRLLSFKDRYSRLSFDLDIKVKIKK